MFANPEEEEFEMAAQEALRQQQHAGSWEQWTEQKLTHTLSLLAPPHMHPPSPQPSSTIDFRIRELSTLSPVAAGHTVRGGGRSGGDMSFSGLHTWGAARLLAQRVLSMAEGVRGKRVVELGAGTGLPSLAAAVSGGEVVVTDRDEELLRNIRFNVELNKHLWPAAEVRVAMLRWEDVEGEGEEGAEVRARWRGAGEVVLGSEVMHVESDMQALAATVGLVLVRGGEFWGVSPAESRRDAIEAFKESCVRWGSGEGASLHVSEETLQRPERLGGGEESEEAEGFVLIRVCKA